MRAQTVGEALAPLLEELGVDVAFGIPGDHTVQIYRGLAGSSIRHITPRHEQGAGFMADGYARVTGKPGVCVVISGPGMTNTITPIAQAHHDSQPLLVISSAVATSDLGRGHGVLHDLPDHSRLMSSVCAFSETVDDPERLPELLCDAYELFGTSRPRPVHIAIPVDVLAGPAPRLTASAVAWTRPAPENHPVQAAAELLRDARAPIMVLGGGAMDAGREALVLAERAAMPIALTCNANGVISTGEDLCLGCSLGTDPVLDACAEADAVVAVGTELSPVEQIDAGRELALGGDLIRIDIDPAQLSRPVPASVGIGGDAGLSLRALADLLPEPPQDRVVQGRVRAQELNRRIEADLERNPWREWIEATRRSVPEEAIVALDSSQLAYALQPTLRASAPRSWLAPYGWGTLGPALPMAIGARAAQEDRPVIAFAGDGGSLFTIAELASAAQHELPVVLVVWNTSSYEAIADAMRLAGGPCVATELTTIDFPALATSFGCVGVRAEEPDVLADAIGEAVARQATTVIDVVPQALPA